MLGHKNVKTTEIYTKVSNTKKNQAVNMIPKLNLITVNERLVVPLIVNTFENLPPWIRAKSSALSFVELQQLANTRCRPVDLKKAFLFSCFTGLQWKDIETLRWNQIYQDSNDIWQIILSRDQDATITLSSQARELVGNGENDDKLVLPFIILPR